MALLEHVGRTVANARLRPRVGHRREAERVLVEVRRLLGVADPELDVIPALDRHEIVVRHGSILLRWRWNRPATTREQDPTAMRHAAADLQRRERLGEENHGEDRAEERLKVDDERRTRRPDPVHRREPQDGRQHERPDDGEREAEPHEPAEVEVLVGELPASGEGEPEQTSLPITSVLMRYGEYVRMSGATATE